jgi:hypothetical protein
MARTAARVRRFAGCIAEVRIDTPLLLSTADW